MIESQQIEFNRGFSSILMTTSVASQGYSQHSHCATLLLINTCGNLSVRSHVHAQTPMQRRDLDQNKELMQPVPLLFTSYTGGEHSTTLRVFLVIFI